MKATLLRFIIALSGASVALSACNSSTSDDSENLTGDESAASTLVKSFALRSNPKIMANLDSVFFSIDQVSAEIFNADSLPWGTDVRKLVVSVNIPSTSAVEVVMPKLSDGQDTVINLLQNAADSINFSRGPVWLRVSSVNGDAERIYTVKVNVHACNPDSLQWAMNPSALPSSLSGVTASKTVEFRGKYYCLSANASAKELTEAYRPNEYRWSPVSLSGLPEKVNVATLTATPDALYLLDSAGALYTSADAAAWTKVSEGWSHLYGAFASDVVGVKGSKWETYPSGASGRLPAGMPVGEASQMWSYSNEWAIEPQGIIVGKGAAWGFDGETWMRLSGTSGATLELPQAAGMTLFPYFTFRTDSKTFLTTRQSAWIALGGQLPSGAMNDAVYVSLDNGIHWRKAPAGLQLPRAMAPRRGASAILYDRAFSSRAVAPITSWDAPYIFLFGGRNAAGAEFNQTWSGVINRLTFKPLQ